MHPALFRIGNFVIGTYGVMIVIGLLTGLWLAIRLGRRRGIAPDFFFDLAFWLMISGFIGARLLFIALFWDEFIHDPLGILFSRQGFVFLGGFITALIVGVWFARRRRVPLLEAADAVAPGLVLAHAFGRIGCFLAGCCYGLACPVGHDGAVHALAVQYPLYHDPSGAVSQMFNFAYWGQVDQVRLGLIPSTAVLPLPILPVQLFESFGNFIICLALVWLWRRRRFSGQIFALYLIAYSVLRFGLEFIRGDADRGLWFGKDAVSGSGVISTSQIICLFTFAVGLTMWFALRKRGIVAIPEAADLSAATGAVPAMGPDGPLPTPAAVKPNHKRKKK